MVHPEHSPKTPGKFCGEESKGITAHTFTQKAVEWSGGFELGASDDIKGVNLKTNFSSTAQTGYDVNAEMMFSYGHSGWLCGTNHIPDHAAQLVMRGTKA